MTNKIQTRRWFETSLLAAACICSPVRALAAISTFTDFAAWQQAAGSSVIEPFDASGLQPFTSRAGIRSQGHIRPASGALSGSVWSDSLIADQFFTQTTFTYQPGPLRAAGAFWDTVFGADGSGIFIAVEGDGVSEVVATNLRGNGSFFGWVSTQPFTTIWLSSGDTPGGLRGGEDFQMDNLRFAPVPEPSITVVLLLGAASLALVGRRKRKAKAAMRS